MRNPTRRATFLVVVDVSVGAGYAMAKGEPPPDLATATLGASLRLSPKLRVAFVGSFGPGQKTARYPGGFTPPFPRFVGDRRTVSSGRLSHQRITLRYRVPLSENVGVVLGVGLASIRYHRSDLIATTLSEVSEREWQQGWGAISVEGLCQVRVSPLLSLLLGISADSADETLYRQPVVLLAIGR